MCDTCGKTQVTGEMKQVFGRINICASCINKILSLHITHSPVKALCPFCHENDNKEKECKYCDIKQFVEIDDEDEDEDEDEEQI